MNEQAVCEIISKITQTLSVRLNKTFSIIIVLAKKESAQRLFEVFKKEFEWPNKEFDIFDLIDLTLPDVAKVIKDCYLRATTPQQVSQNQGQVQPLLQSTISYTHTHENPTKSPPIASNYPSSAQVGYPAPPISPHAQQNQQLAAPPTYNGSGANAYHHQQQQYPDYQQYQDYQQHQNYQQYQQNQQNQYQNYQAYQQYQESSAPSTIPQPTAPLASAYSSLATNSYYPQQNQGYTDMQPPASSNYTSPPIIHGYGQQYTPNMQPSAPPAYGSSIGMPSEYLQTPYTQPATEVQTGTAVALIVIRWITPQMEAGHVQHGFQAKYSLQSIPSRVVVNYESQEGYIYTSVVPPTCRVGDELTVLNQKLCIASISYTQMGDNGLSHKAATRFISIEDVPMAYRHKAEEQLRKLLNNDPNIRPKIHVSSPHFIFEVPSQVADMHLRDEAIILIEETDYRVMVLPDSPPYCIIPHVPPLAGDELGLLTHRLQSENPSARVEYVKELAIILVRNWNSASNSTSVQLDQSRKLGIFEAYPIRILVKLPPESSSLQGVTDLLKYPTNSYGCHQLSPSVYGLYFRTYEEAKQVILHGIQGFHDFGGPVLFAPDGAAIHLDGIPDRCDENYIRKHFPRQDISIWSMDIDAQHNHASIVCEWSHSFCQLTESDSISINQSLVQVCHQLPSRLAFMGLPFEYQQNTKLFEHDLANSSIMKQGRWQLRRKDTSIILYIYSHSFYSELQRLGGINVSNLFLQLVDPSHRVAGTEFDESWYQNLDSITSVDGLLERLDVLSRSWNCLTYRTALTSYQDKQHSCRAPVEREAILQNLRGMRITAIINTISVCEKEYYLIQSGAKVQVPHPPPTIVYTEPPIITVAARDSRNVLTIEVVSSDCIAAIRTLLSEGLRPALVSATTSRSAGGGYKRGEYGPEEDLFRRSNIYQTLDTLGTRNSKGTKKNIFPLCDFGAAYSPSVSVFREEEKWGFEFMKEVVNIDVISACPLRGVNPLSEIDLKDYIIKTQQKIKTIFSVAVSKNHDSLVIGAFGCQGQANLAEVIAGIFRECASMYASYFKKLVFAIIDERALTTSSNMETPLSVFQKELHGQKITSVKLPPSTKPYVPCKHGIRCRDSSVAHRENFAHMHLCLNQENCKLVDNIVHWEMWIHQSECPDSGNCEKWQDPHHSKFFRHPPECHLQGSCTNTDPIHLRDNLHVKCCPKGLRCHEMNNQQHCRSFRHIRKLCPRGTFCYDYNDGVHCADFWHPFKPICRETPHSCTNIERSHQEKYSHLCEWGQFCTKLNDDEHLAKFVHIVRRVCSVKECEKRFDDQHCREFSHQGIRDFRKLCSKGLSCQNIRNLGHISEFYHSRRTSINCPSNMLNLQIDFEKNHFQISRNIQRHIPGPISKEMSDWFGRLRPIHRCMPHTLKSIIFHGNVLSFSKIVQLDNPSEVFKEVRSHPQIASIVDALHEDNLEAMTERKKVVDEFISIKVDVRLGELFHQNTPQNHGLKTHLDSRLDSSRKRCRDCGLKDASLKELESIVEDVAQACFELKSKNPHTQAQPDLEMRTGDHVFSILGPNWGSSYGPILVVFKQDILSHPDTNITPCSGTWFQNGSVEEHRPWIKYDPAHKVSQFDSYKLHATVHEWHVRLAEEMVTFFRQQGQCMNVQELLKAWASIDSHYVLECHLPSSIPIGFIHKIIMPQDVYNKLDSATKDRLKKLFPDGNEKVLKIIPQDQGAKLEERNRATEECVEESIRTFDTIYRAPGYSFSTEPGSKPTIVPSQFSRPGEGHVYFKACSPKVLVYLFLGQNLHHSPEHCFTIYIKTTSTKSHAYIFYGFYTSPKGAIASEKYIHSLQNFNANLNPDEYISYYIRVADGRLTLRHTDSSRAYNRFEMEVTHPELKKVQRVAFCSEDLTVNLSHVQILTDPLLETQPEIPAGAARTALPRSTPQPQKPLEAEPQPQSERDKGLVDQFVEKIRAVDIISGPPPKPPAEESKGRSSSFFKGIFDSKPKPMCPHDLNCLQYHEEEHRKSTTHNILPPCPDGGLCRFAYQTNNSHDTVASHPCRFGVNCKDFKSKSGLHMSRYYHIALPQCPDGARCPLVGDLKHRREFSHPGWPDILIMCSRGKTCPDINRIEHLRVYGHGG
eukprot:TRINITY_DN4037_c0_g1_i1.p1 TRINITY_DN4037_c0_g1~~TRINITY_DN4037_c0_g1_i1.p1  ORF type:complete len:2133 (+),score=265.13 TRINITY_DN4037_c0_g1_i1:272-6670(+)